jgi:hypothetical protein
MILSFVKPLQDIDLKVIKYKTQSFFKNSLARNSQDKQQKRECDGVGA